MEKYNKILASVKEYANNLKEDLNKVNKSNVKDFIKERIYLLSGISIITIALIMLIGASCITSKDELIENFKISMTKGNVNRIYGDIFVEQDKASKSELEPLIEYYNGDISKVRKVVNELKTSDESSIFQIKSNKKIFWQDYYLEVKTVGIKVNSNFDKATIFINNIEFGNTNVKRGLIPGIYKVKAQINTEYGIVEEEKEVSLMQNEEINFNLDVTNLNIKSNFNDAKVFINNKDINKKVSEIINYGPIPTNKNIEMHLEREFPWGIIKSEKVKINDVPNINIDINMVNEELTTQIETNINRFYKSVFNALNERDYKLILLTNEEIQKKIYDEINKNSLIFKNNYEISDLETKIENSEFKYEDNTYKAKIVIKIQYSIYKKIFPMSKTKEETMFLTNMELVDKNWIVKEIQKFSLD